MALELAKTGDKLDLTKVNPGLTKVNAAAGWDANTGDGGQIDVDLFAFLLNNKSDKGGKLIDSINTKGSPAILYFGTPGLALPGIKLSGDNRTGAGDGDDETIYIDFATLDPRVKSIVIAVNIFDRSTGYKFGKIKNAFLRIDNAHDGTALVKYDLTEDYSSSTGVVVGEIYNHNNEWKFEALGKPADGSIEDILKANNF